MRSGLSRSVLLHALPFAAVQWPSQSVATTLSFIDPMFARLRNRYILLRPGETVFERAAIVDSNPINKASSERGLTTAGREQVRRAADALRQRGIVTPIIFYDNGARASQTADILARELTIPRARIEPEFRWLEARGYGAMDGSDLREALIRIRSLDMLDIDNQPEESEDGTPSDSVNEIFSRLRNTIAKVENSYSGEDTIIIGGDSTVLSVFAAAATGIDLREHSRFELRPGTFYDLREIAREVREGRFEGTLQRVAPDEEVALGREELRQMGPKIFSDTAAGSWVLGPGQKR